MRFLRSPARPMRKDRTPHRRAEMYCPYVAGSRSAVRSLQRRDREGYAESYELSGLDYWATAGAVPAVGAAEGPALDDGAALLGATSAGNVGSSLILGNRTISMRRFSLRPASVWLFATGSYGP